MLFRAFIGASALALLGASCGGCDSGGFAADAPAIDAPAPGSVTLAWTLTDTGGLPIACEQVGGSFVLLELRNRTTSLGTVVSFACARGRETSPPIEPGVYDVLFELRGVDLAGVTAPEQKSVVVEPGRDTQLAPVAFAIDARGSLVLSLAAPPATSNCRPPGSMGAGITGITITLEQAGGGCAPVTFVRARGSTMLGTYTVNCSSPQVSACIETDETLTVTSLASGPYVIHVRGKIGAVDCWRNDNSLIVPPQGKRLTETLNLAFQSGTPGC
jgi:hypothetical protein